MSLSLTSVENEIRARAGNLGGFNSTGAITRMRYSILRALQTLSSLRDWRWLNRTTTITTTSGNLGPYDAPASFLRFAALRQVSLFGFTSKDVLGPILATDEKIYTPYFRIDNDSIYFFDDPGDGSVTLNYVAEVDDSIVEGELDASLAIVPNGLKPALIEYAMADVLGYVPNGAGLAQGKLQLARTYAEDYWHQEFAGNVQRGISPKGVNKVSIDNHAQMPSLGFSVRWR